MAPCQLLLGRASPLGRWGVHVGFCMHINVLYHIPMVSDTMCRVYAVQPSAPLTSANTPLNPTATPIVSTRSKDPFADLAAF